MLVSTRGRYGMRMMIDIARHQGQGRVALREIGERQGISVKYLEQLARALCAAGLLEGSRGQGGGIMNFGRSNVKPQDPKKNKVRFDDVPNKI